MEYTVLTGKSNSLSDARLEIERKVEKLLKQGWELNGGISVSNSQDDYSDCYVLAQALVKK